MEARYHQMLMALSPEARLKKGCAMFDTAKKLVLASLRAELGPNPDPSELRRRVLLRFYGNDLPESTIRRFLTASGERDASSR
jgi:hypothetical protein